MRYPITKQLFEFNIRSFIIVIFAYAGAGMQKGIDLVLVTLLPAFLMLYMYDLFITKKKYSDLFIIKKKDGVLLILLAVLLLVALARVPYIDMYPPHTLYPLWPIKAIILMIMIACTPEIKWPMGNTLMFSIVCIGVLAMSTIEHYRLHFFVGPNMLYRFFGILLIISVIHFLVNQRPSRWLLVGTAGLALYGMILTAASGALLVIAVVAAVALFKLSKRFFIATVILAIPILIISFNSPFLINLLRDLKVHILGRLAGKLSRGDDRFSMWAEILRHPFSAYGHSYDTISLGTNVDPHSMFFELYAYYGVIGLVVFGVVLAGLIKSLPLLPKGHVLPMVLLVMFIGAMLDGNFTHNYGVVGLAAGLLIQMQHKKYYGSCEQRDSSPGKVSTH